MNELWMYIIQTLKDAWVNTILQKDYLSDVGKWLLQYLTFNWLFLSILGLLMLIAIPVIYRNWKKKALASKGSSYWWERWLDGIGHIIAIIVLSLAAIIMLCSWIDTIAKVFFVPDIAILQYIR